MIMLISLKQRDELITAVKKYGEAEFEAGRDIGSSHWASGNPDFIEVVAAFEKVIQMVNQINL